MGSSVRTAACAAAITAALVGLLHGCRAAPPQPRNVLLILVDALRADHLGAYGYDRATSPTFDTLAARGTLFRRAHSTTSWTNPAVESLFTAEHPRVLQPGAAEFIAPNTRTLAQAFRDHGYRTAAVIANPVLAPTLGYAQGFDDYIGVSGWTHGWNPRPKEPAEQVNAAALQWLVAARAGNQPWFLYVHYMDTHWPYQPPPVVARRFWRAPEIDIETAMAPLNQRLREHPSDVSPADVRQGIDLYDAAIAHFDDALGALLRALETSGQLAHTVVCVVADHGEEFADHGGFLHARTLYQEVLRVPLLIVEPAETGARVDRLVQITDVGRTLLERAGLNDGAFPGQSLLGPHHDSGGETVFAELSSMPLLPALHQYAVLSGNHKLIVAPDGSQFLFDIRNDPNEQHSETAERPNLVAQLTMQLTNSMVARAQPRSEPLDAAARERLRALGYDF